MADLCNELGLNLDEVMACEPKGMEMWSNYEEQLVAEGLGE